MTTEQNEQQQLAGLEERYQWTVKQLEGHMPTNRPASLEEIQNAANYAQQLIGWFQTNYGPTASSLQAAGFSRLANRLNAIIADLQQAYKMYTSMYQKKMQPPTPPTSFPPSSSNTMNEINQMSHRNDVFRASMLNKCWSCGLELGNAFNHLEWCPRCKAMLRQ